MGSTIMSEGCLLRKEHLCAKEFQLFFRYDILWPALSSDNIRAKQTKNGEKFEQWHIQIPYKEKAHAFVL